MNWSLNNHTQGYQLSFRDVFLACCGLTGGPYAQRHLEQSRKGSSWMAHRAIFLIECMPILGGCAALAEGIVHVLFRSSSPIPTSSVVKTEKKPTSGFPREKPLDWIKAQEKMVTNLTKSIHEHFQSEVEQQAYNELHNKLTEFIGTPSPDETEQQAFERVYKKAHTVIQAFIEKHQKIRLENNPFIQASEISSSPRESRPLRLCYHFCENQGTRDTMEDAHFHLKMKTEKTDGTLVGVFDGHGGQEVAQFASKKFKKLFPKKLEKTNVFQAFEEVVEKIHQEVMTHTEWEKMGSTAVICYIDKRSHRVYTATLGDCEANISRKIGEEMKSIPLSPVRDWTSKKDLQRLKKFFRGTKKVDEYIEECTQEKICEKLNGKDVILSKEIRSYLAVGVNTPRAFGDGSDRGTDKYPLVIHKPKITVSPEIQEGDILTLACDGLKDYLPEKDIISILSTQKTTTKMSENLVTAALRNMDFEKHQGDNVTVCAIKVSFSDKKK